MQGVGRADDLLYFKCLADAVPCERLLDADSQVLTSTLLYFKI